MLFAKFIVFVLIGLLIRGVLDDANTYTMRLTALIVLLLMWGSVVAHFYLTKQMEMKKGFFEEMEKVKKLIKDWEDERRPT